MEEQKREFTGVWIPKRVIEDKNLKPVDRIIYAEVSCFEICTMTNATLADRAGVSEDTASRSVGRLKENGYIAVIGFNGRVRKMQSLNSMPPQNAEAASAKPHKQPPQNKSQDNSIDNKENTGIAKAIGETPKEYGNSEINELFKYWEEVVGYGITSKRQANRNACSNLMKKHTAEGVRKLIVGVSFAQSDRYAPRIADFISLQSKMNELILWGKKSHTKQEVF